MPEATGFLALTNEANDVRITSAERFNRTVVESSMRQMLRFSIVSAMLLAGDGATFLEAAPSQSIDPSRFTYTRIFCTPNGETHFGKVTVELSKMNIAPPAPPIYVGGNQSASETFFIEMDARYGAHDLETHLNHPAPAALFVTLLAGVMSVTTTDGETRRFRPGDVIRADDTLPCKGHITVVGNRPVFAMITR